MTSKRRGNFHLFAWCSIVAIAALPVSAFAGDAQFLNIFDTGKMTEKGRTMSAQMSSLIKGKNIGVETWFVGGGTAPKGKVESHYHPEEHFWMQFAGTSHFTVVFNDAQKNRVYDADAGTVMHMPPNQQHLGEHGKEDAYMVTVSTPHAITNVFTRAPGMEDSHDHYDSFDFDDAQLTMSEKDWVYTRKGKLGAGLGQEAVLIKKATKKDYIVSARKAPMEEVAIIYKGQVKVTGCGESRILGPGDLFYCPGALMYTALGKEDARVMRVFTPADSGSFISKY